MKHVHSFHGFQVCNCNKISGFKHDHVSFLLMQSLTACRVFGHVFGKDFGPVPLLRRHLRLLELCACSVQGHEVRTDGRGVHTARHTTINTGNRPDRRLREMNMRCVFSLPGSISTADGSALVHSGDTVVLCGVKAVRLVHHPPSLSHCHTITVTLSYHHCHTVTPSLSHCHTITVALSHHHCHTITVALSHHHCHTITVALSHCHTITCTVTLSHHHVTLTVTPSHHHCHCHTITVTVTPSLLHYHTITYFSFLQELANPAVRTPSQGYLGEHAVACHLAGWPVTFTPLPQCATWSCRPVALPTSPLALPPLKHRHSHKHCRTHGSGTPPHTLPADANAIGPSHAHTQIRLSQSCSALHLTRKGQNMTLY